MEDKYIENYQKLVDAVDLVFELMENLFTLDQQFTGSDEEYQEMFLKSPRLLSLGDQWMDQSYQLAVRNPYTEQVFMQRVLCGDSQLESNK